MPVGVVLQYKYLHTFISHCSVLTEIGPQNRNTASSQTATPDFMLFDRKYGRTSLQDQNKLPTKPITRTLFFYYLIVYLLMCVILSCHAFAWFFFASLQIPYTKWGTSLGYMQMWRQQLLRMPVFPDANKDRSAVNISTPLNKGASYATHLCLSDSTYLCYLYRHK